ncbi:MAG: alpha/beta hydrolase [Clostridia bacterium]|nr:alpha/beta hydrolase [Clostridia bacterium]
MQKISLWGDNVPYLDIGADTPNTMDFYPTPTWHPAPCVVVFPGGGFTNRAPHEGAPIAQFFNSRGMHAVVVNYRVAPNYYPAPLADCQRAIKLLRANAKAWAVDVNRIVTLGFSAGGYLSAACATLPDVTRERIGADAVDRENARPNGSVLCYPGISFSKEFGIYRAAGNLLGSDVTEREYEYFCLEKRVSDETPPAFIWHTSDDNVVNVIESLRYGEALRAHKIPFEMHIFPKGPHGLGLATGKKDVEQWADMCADWIIANIK